MSAARRTSLPGASPAIWQHPIAIGLAVTSFGAMVALNAITFALSDTMPWLLGTVLVSDMLLVGTGIAIAAREALRAENQTYRAEQLSTQAKDALTRSEARFAAIIDSAMDPMLSIDQDHKILLFNRAAEQVFGCRRDEALGTALDRFLPTRFRDAHRNHIQHFGHTGVTSRRMGDLTTLWALRANGDEFPIEASISQAVEGDRRYYTVILRDITLRKQYEDKLKQQQSELRELSARVFEAREEEKTRVARELHDELGQLLTAAKMDLAWLGQRLSGDQELRAKSKQIEATLDLTVTSMRRIAADLRPLMLDDLGLADAVNWLLEDFGQRSGVHYEFTSTSDEELNRTGRDCAITVYRALQESLTNITRHAEARNAWILLAVKDGTIRLDIEDDGRGISPEDLAKARSLGLKGMRERILRLDGTFEITRAPRGGTRVSLIVPLRETVQGEAT